MALTVWSFTSIPLWMPTMPGRTMGWLFSFRSGVPWVAARVWMMALRALEGTSLSISAMNSEAGSGSLWNRTWRRWGSYQATPVASRPRDSMPRASDAARTDASIVAFGVRLKPAIPQITASPPMVIVCVDG